MVRIELAVKRTKCEGTSLSENHPTKQPQPQETTHQRILALVCITAPKALANISGHDGARKKALERGEQNGHRSGGSGNVQNYNFAEAVALQRIQRHERPEVKMKMHCRAHRTSRKCCDQKGATQGLFCKVDSSWEKAEGCGQELRLINIEEPWIMLGALDVGAAAHNVRVVVDVAGRQGVVKKVS